jgi:hypothetical protein
VVGSFVVDFYCAESRVIVELDGTTHEGREAQDLRRQKELEELGFTMLRFRNHEVYENLEGFLERVLYVCRKRMQKRGLKLMLDFVPNHTAPDHPWIDVYPDYFVHGSETDLARSPQNYCRVKTKSRPRVFAYGRDPYFDGWPDTLQLNYGNPKLQQAMIGELQRIAGQCDGVRCDMAMLVLPDVFERTWGIRADFFWPKCYFPVANAKWWETASNAKWWAVPTLRLGAD